MRDFSFVLAFAANCLTAGASRVQRNLHNHATIDGKHLPGNVAGGRAGQEQGGLGDVLRLAEGV